MLCPQLKENLKTINSLKSELDLELLKIEKMFQDLKSDSQKGKEFKAERAELMNKIKAIKTKFNSSINELNVKLLENPRLALKQDWKNIYKNWFDKDINISDIKIPEGYDPEKHFGLIIPGDLTMDEIVKAMQNKFDVRFSDYEEGLDALVIKNDRPIDKSYAILFKNNVEADEDLRSLSANQLAKQGVKGITLKERLLMEILYFDKTGKHSDNNNNTLCSGSLSRGKAPFPIPRVPTVRWLSKVCFSIYWCYTSNSDSFTRSRSVVS